MLLRVFLVGYFYFLSSHFFAQEQDLIFFHFKFIDENTKERVGNVSVTYSIKDSIYKAFSSILGEFDLPMIAQENLKLEFSHGLYEPQTYTITKNGRNNILIKLKPIKIQDFKTITVSAPGKVDTVFESTQYSVADYAIMDDGKYFLLVYAKNRKSGTTLLLFDGEQSSQEIGLPESIKSLKMDFRKQVCALGEQHVYALKQVKQDILISKLNRDYFKQYVEPIIDTNDSKLFFSNFNKDYPAFDYFSYDQLDSSYTKIMTIQDDLMMELYRSEYKWADVRTKLWAKEKEIETGIDAEIWVGAQIFTQSIYYKQLYAPFFQVQDTLYIFDYYKDRLISYSKNGEVLNTVPIFHHYHPKETGWKKQLIQDPKTLEVYAYFEKNGYGFVAKINLKTGVIEQKYPLKFRYVENVQVNGGHVYYVYRPFESLQKKYLYKEKL